MIRHYIYIVVSAVAAFVFASCELDTSSNGDLDGMWRLAQVDTLATSGVNRMEGEKKYWMFQYSLLQLEDKAGNAGSVLLRFEHNGNALRLYDSYAYDREEGDKPLDDPSVMAPYGVNALDETFTIEALDGRRMVLSNEELRLSFRKL